MHLDKIHTALAEGRKTKIGIMGTHGAGKTTLALYFASQLKSIMPSARVGLVAEVARCCPLPVNRNPQPAAQRWIFHQQMVSELEGALRDDILLCERTILDNLAYSRLAGFPWVEAYLPLALEWLAWYDHIFWLRPTRPPAADGFRDTALQFFENIDAIPAQWVDEHQLKVDERRIFNAD